MASRGLSILVALLSVTLLEGCGNAREEFERQLNICAAGENNGVLTAAAEGCGHALDIAQRQNFPPDEISDLSYRLGQIERKQGRFVEAERLLQASLDYESQIDDPAGIASRLVELSVSLAGQNRWEEGVTLLTRATPHLQSLVGSQREAAVNALRGYAAQLRKRGESQTATSFAALALELATE